MNKADQYVSRIYDQFKNNFPAIVSGTLTPIPDYNLEPHPKPKKKKPVKVPVVKEKTFLEVWREVRNNR